MMTDFVSIKEIIKLFKESGLSKLSVKDSKIEISMEIGHLNTKNSVLDVPVMKELSEINLENTVDAPMVGSFYRSEGPDEKPFVEVGDRVKKGDTLCIIEAMKVMNEIKAKSDGLIKEVKVKDGDSIEFGKPLFVME